MSEKLIYPSAARNAHGIFACLEKLLPDTGTILEIASGSGQHLSQLANLHGDLIWCPSDPDDKARSSIEAWRRAENGDNVQIALDLDVTAPNWWRSVTPPLAGIMAINMIHISPWQATLGLMCGAGAVLGGGGFLYLYGPYKIDGAHTAPSNEAFDASLRARDANWGVRDKEDVVAAAETHGLRFADMIAMPANNFSLIFRKR